MEKSVLITGGTGLIGGRLTQFLKEDGYLVRYLSRKQNLQTDPQQFKWDLKEQDIDPNAFNGIHHIMHLAGANVGEKRWTSSRKRAIIESRTETTRLLYDYLKNNEHQVKTFVAASGINLYKMDTGEYMDEESEEGNGFLTEVVKKWEAAVDKISELGIRVIKIRTGVVLSNHGGALPQMMTPIKYGVGAPLGCGKQYMSWIHIDDLCRMYQFALEKKELSGAFNGVAPEPVTNAELTRKIARTIKRPLLLPPIPAVVLKLMLGEMSSMVLEGAKISNKKIKDEGFEYEFPEIDEALINLLKS